MLFLKIIVNKKVEKYDYLYFSMVKSYLKKFFHLSFPCSTAFVTPVLNGKYTI